MTDIVTRLLLVAGEDFTARDCRVTNPRITARESIEIANYIKSLKDDLDFFLEQSYIIEHMQDHEKMRSLREKYGMSY